MNLKELIEKNKKDFKELIESPEWKYFSYLRTFPFCFESDECSLEEKIKGNCNCYDYGKCSSGEGGL